MHIHYRFCRIPFFIIFLLLSTSNLAFIPHYSETKTAAVIYLKHNPPFCPSQSECDPWWTPEDQALILPPRHSASGYQYILNSLVTSYYNRNSFNLVHINFTSIVNPNSEDGWYVAPHKIFQYNQGTADLHLDGVNVAFGAIGNALDDYDYLIIVHNYHGRSGQARGMQGPPDFGPAETTYYVGSGSVRIGDLYVGENSSDELFAALASHELGHLLGVPDQYSGFTDAWPAMGPWDLMADDAFFNHFSAWSKLNRGWIPTITDMPCLDGACQVTTTLQAIELPGNNVLKIPFIASPFTGYLVECRVKYNGDFKIPEQGVLVTSIDPWRPVGSSIAQVVSPSGDNDFTTAALAPGETFVDSAREITITYVSQEDGYKCKVKAERGDIHAPDPSNIQSVGEESEPDNIKYKSRDIWIDSQMNGWDVYPFGESFSLEGEIISPAGYGDPFWVGHENRIGFKVRNTGYSTADQVIVDIFVTQPLKIQIPSLNCSGPRKGTAKLLGTVVIDHLDEGEVYSGFVPWTPTINSSAQVTVQIRDYTGEITHSNNTAAETYMSHLIAMENTQEQLQNMDLSWTYSIPVEMTQNCQYGTPFRLQKVEIKAIAKKDWVTQFNPEQMMLEPGRGAEVQVVSMPPSDAQPGDCQDAAFEITALVGDVFMPVNGFSYRSCVVEPSILTCNSVEKSGGITIAGEIAPMTRQVPITLEFTSPSGITSLKNVNTSRKGTYQDLFIPNEIGNWKFQSFWQGDDRTAPAQSGVCDFTVKNFTPQFVLNQNSNCRSGPGMEYDVVTAWNKGDILDVESRSPDGYWLYTQHLRTKCWVAIGLGNLNVDVEDLPVRTPPPAPTLTPTVGLCEVYTTKSVCLRYKTVCKWQETAGVIPLQGKCVNR